MTEWIELEVPECKQQAYLSSSLQKLVEGRLAPVGTIDAVCVGWHDDVEQGGQVFVPANDQQHIGTHSNAYIHLPRAQKCMLVASPRVKTFISAMMLPIFNAGIFWDGHLKAKMKRRHEV